MNEDYDYYLEALQEEAKGLGLVIQKKDYMFPIEKDAMYYEVRQSDRFTDKLVALAVKRQELPIFLYAYKMGVSATKNKIVDLASEAFATFLELGVDNV